MKFKDEHGDAEITEIEKSTTPDWKKEYHLSAHQALHHGYCLGLTFKTEHKVTKRKPR